jgi:Flp pilus assembly protein TadG
MYTIRMRDDSGGSLVEFAVVAPLLFVILFGIIEFGFLLYDKAVITNASREGARAGIVYDTALRDADLTANETAVRNKIIQVIYDYLDYNPATCSSRLVSFGAGCISPEIDPCEESVSGEPLVVKVNYTFTFLVFSNIIKLLPGEFSGSIPLKAETIMRLE